MPNLRTTGGFFAAFTGQYGNLNALTLGALYHNNSGNKVISPFLSYYITDEHPTITHAEERHIADYLERAYGLKWQQLSDALQAQYNLLDEYTETITKHGTKDEDSTLTKNKGAVSKSIQYGQEQETYTKGTITEQDSIGAQQKTLQYGQTEETYNKGNETKNTNYGQVTLTDQFGAKTTNVSNSTNGFNGGMVPSDTSATTEATRSDTHTTGQHSDSESTTYGTTTTQNAQHTDSVSESARQDTKTTTHGDDSITKSQHTDTQTEQERVDSDVLDGSIVTAETINKSGRKTPAQELIEKEIELRKFDLFKTIIKDIDSILCLKVYL